jgi:hypothetical protein
MESRQAVISHGRCLEAKLNGKAAEDAIVQVRGAALEAAVGAAPLTHGEDNLGAVVEAVDHLCNDRHIVLQVGVERDYSIGFADLADQASQQCILVSDIAR